MPNARPRLSRAHNNICVETPYDQSFVNAIKSVIPKTHRNYTNGMWIVNPIYFDAVVAVMKNYWGSSYIDSTNGVSEPQTSEWKERWELFKNSDGKKYSQYQEKSEWSKTAPKASTSAFMTLHVTQDAPKQVITAAFRALASIHHPDNGGDTETMARINAAYQELKKKGYA